MNPLTEKLRPKKFQHLILPPRISEQLNAGKLEQNFLLYGSQGLGKTSAAKVMASSDGFDHIYINCSDETGVDVIRDKITSFCSSASVLNIGGRMKCVILDELDGVSDQFFKALRGTIEKFAVNTRFIATCNYINKIPEPIQSRFVTVNMDMLDGGEVEYVKLEWRKRFGTLFTKLNIGITEDLLENFIDAAFPDMRKAIYKVETLSISKVENVTKSQITSKDWEFEPMFKLIIAQGDSYENYKHIVKEYQGSVTEVLASLGSDFPEWIADNHPDKLPKIPVVIIEVAAHQAMRNQVIDPVISLLSLVYKLQKSIQQA